MAKRSFDGAKFSPWQLLTSANAFYALSCFYTDRMPEDVTDPNPQFPPLAEGQASATNRILALELYLKALLVGASVQFPANHDLLALFRALPEDIRKDIEAGYEERRGLADDPAVFATVVLRFQLTHTPRQPIEELPEPKQIDRSLVALLERNRNGFVESRYLFDQASFDAPSLFVYEHLRLAVLCGVLCNLLETELQNRQFSYRRAFSFPTRRNVIAGSALPPSKAVCQ
ncbi:hypothetical protein ACSUZJ_05235 [Telluria sp. B2]